MNAANIRIVLVETSHTGNIGSAARAMKTMGLTTLYLVNPIVKPDSHALAMAAKAVDVVKNAVFCDTLAQAVEDCQLVVGTSIRFRSLDWPALSPRVAANKLITEAKLGPVAIVFGRERTGLTNEELHQCHYHVSIPSAGDYPSLNVAMSVQILAYEIRMAGLIGNNNVDEVMSPTASYNDSYPVQSEIENLYRHFEQTLRSIGFINQSHPGQVMNRLRRLYTRARLEAKELNILRGILSAVDRKQKSECAMRDESR